MTQINKCHRCGATSYKPVIKRDESGTMKPSGEHQCVGCKLIFTDIDDWRIGTPPKGQQTPGGRAPSEPEPPSPSQPPGPWAAAGLQS